MQRQDPVPELPAVLQRIADALDRLAPARAASADWLASPAYVWDGARTRALAALEAPELSLLRGIERQKAAVVENVTRLARGHAAHDMLLWGARGMGKSALIRASTRAAQAEGGKLALVQVQGDALAELPELFAALAGQPRHFLIYIDDLGFGAQDGASLRQLRSALDGGIAPRPRNVCLAVTANRRAVVAREASEQGDPLNPRDAIDDQLALADRFGLTLGFHAPSQEEYLAIVAGYAAYHGLAFDPAEACEWALRRGGRSGRVAWQFVTELAGRARRALG